MAGSTGTPVYSQEIVSILDRLTDGFAALDRDWKFIYVNGAGAELFGCTPEDLFGQNIWEKVSQLKETEFEQALRRAMAGQAQIDVESWYGSRRRWFSTRIYPSDTGVSLYWRDITQRKRSEALLEHRARLSQLGADIGLSMTLDVPLSESLRQCTDAVVRHLEAAFARIWTMSEDGKTLELQASSGIYTSPGREIQNRIDCERKTATSDQ